MKQQDKRKLVAETKSLRKGLGRIYTQLNKIEEDIASMRGQMLLLEIEIKAMDDLLETIIEAS